MKVFKFIILLATTVGLFGCASTVNTTRVSHYPPTPLSEPIEMYGLNDAVPANYQGVVQLESAIRVFLLIVDCKAYLKKQEILVAKWAGMQ
jgi:hypothetical protein